MYKDIKQDSTKTHILVVVYRDIIVESIDIVVWL